jgi:hypothetical protein
MGKAKRWMVAVLLAGSLPVAMVAGEGAGTQAGDGGGAGTRAAESPVNLERALQVMLTVDVEGQGLGDFIRRLSEQTRTNIVVNWNAVGSAGVTRTTPVSLHVKGLPYEQVIKTLVEVLPGGGGGKESTRLNYTVGDNTLVITTNGAIGKGVVTQLYPLQKVMEYRLVGEAGGAGGDAKLVERVLREVLRRAGEPLEDRNHGLAMKNGMLAATISERGQMVLSRATGMLNLPVKPGQFAPGTAVTASAKKAGEAWSAAGGGGGEGVVRLAREPEKAGVNIALLPGTKEELGKGLPQLAATVTDGGVVLIGPREALAGRTMFAAYELREVIKRLGQRQKPAPAPVEVQAGIVKMLETQVPAVGGWGGEGDLGRLPGVMIGYNGVLLVFGTADQQRGVSAALGGLMR